MIIYFTDKFAGSRDESHRLLERAIAVHTGDEKKAKTLIGALKKGEHGKPFIEGFKLGRKCDKKAIADRWFAPEDAAELAETFPADSKSAADAFFRIWTRREALTKALGRTVYDPDLPAVSGEYVMIDGKRYTIRDIQIPQMPEVYSAMCIYYTDSISELKFIRL